MRPSKDDYFMGLAKLAAQRTTCIRRGVGCVLVNERGHILSIGYNGVAAGLPHCNELKPGLDAWQQTEALPEYFPHACAGHNLPPGQDSCGAVHAEVNAVLQCRDPWAIAAAYVTLSPCVPCLKLLLNTSCKEIVFLAEHAGPNGSMSQDLWLRAGRTWRKIERPAQK